MVKVLTYRIENGKTVITGDSSKGEIPSGDYQFTTDGPILMEFKNIEDVQILFNTLLQGNHSYKIAEKKDVGFYHLVIIDGIKYSLTYNLKYCVLHSVETNREEILGFGNTPRNTFNMYGELLQYLTRTKVLFKLDEKIKTILTANNLNYKIDEIDECTTGISIKVVPIEYNDGYSFSLFLSQNHKLEFRHLFEREGEYYSSGIMPITKNDILKEIRKQNRILELIEKYTKMFDVQLFFSPPITMREV